MNSALKYPGAKNRIAKWIISYIPPHDVYLEPFAGSLAVLLNKEPATIETVNDLHDEVVNYFKVLRDQPAQLINEIYKTPYARSEYNASYICNKNDDEVERARKFAVRCWQGFGAANLYRNGFKTGQQSNSPNCAKGWSQLPITLQQVSNRLKNVQIENLDAIELIKRYDTKDVFIYCDPPYLVNTRKNYLYKHEMSNEQHIELLNLLKSHPGKVMISGYDNELYDTALSNWHKEYKDTTAEQGLRRRECLWMNYDLQMHLPI